MKICAIPGINWETVYKVLEETATELRVYKLGDFHRFDETRAYVGTIDKRIAPPRDGMVTVDGINKSFEDVTDLLTPQVTRVHHVSRDEHLHALSEDYGIPLDVVHALASLLGPEEDYDGLPSALQDLVDGADLGSLDYPADPTRPF